MRSTLLLLIAALAACSHPATQTVRADGEDFTRYHRLGVLPFEDSRGSGIVIADEIKRGLEKGFYDKVDTVALEAVLKSHHIDRGEDIDAETLFDIHTKARCDAVIFGQMAPDWSAAKLTMVETNMGEPVLHAVLRPANGKKFFFNADAVVQEALKVLTDPKYGS